MAKLVWRGPQVVDQVKRKMLERGVRAAHEVSTDIARRVAIPGPPARPGQPPRRRTGSLFQSIVGTATIQGSKIVVQIRAGIPAARLWATQARYPFFGKADRRKLLDILTGRR